MHALCVGRTSTGKTTLIKQFADIARQRGVGVLVLDPTYDDWNADLVFNERGPFLDAFWSSRSCLVIIDEGSENAGRYDSDVMFTATRGRHLGHRIIYCSQRGADINKTIRAQCTDAYIFASGLDDLVALRRDFILPENYKALVHLPQGAYCHAQTINPPELKKVIL